MKKNVLFQLILMFFVPCLFILGIDQQAHAVVYTKLTGGTASASTTASGSSPSYAFDSSTSSVWASIGFPASMTDYLSYQLPSAKVVQQYKVLSLHNISWGLYGSNNGTSWTLLHSGTPSNLGQMITISNTTAYLYYRISAPGVVVGSYYMPPPMNNVPQPLYGVDVTELELWAQLPPGTQGAPTGPGTNPNGTYTVNWVADPAATSYQLEENYNSGAWSNIYNSSGTSTQVTGRSPGTWCYRLKASNAIGSSPDYSGTLTVLVAPPVPGTPTGPASPYYDSAYTISWNSATGASSYTLQEKLGSGGWSTIYTGASISFNLSGKTAGTWYYQVMACGATCSAYSTTPKSVVLSVPATPAPTGPSTDDDGSYRISWGTATGATSYQLEESYNGGGWATIYNSTGLYSDLTGRSPGTWNYRLKASNAVGSSAYSNTVTVLVAPVPPNTPTGPASTNYDGIYTISWGAVTGATSYQLQERYNEGSWNTVYNGSSTTVSVSGRNTAGTWDYKVRAFGVAYSAFSGIKSVVVSVPATPGTPTGPSTDADGSYAISWSAATGAATYQLEENLNGGSWSTIYNSTGLSTTRSSSSPGTWNYRLKASNNVGPSPAYSGTLTVLVAPPVPVPTGPASPYYDSAYTISWGSTTGATSYTLQEKLGSGSWSTIYTGGNTSFNLSGKTAGTWNYQVNACGATCSAYSTTPKSVVVSVPVTPGTPTGPSTDADGSYTICWSAATGAATYQLEEKYNDGAWSTIYDSSGLSKTRSGRNPGTWYYRLKATNPVGSSPSYSGTVIVLVPPAIPALSSTGTFNEGMYDVGVDGNYTVSWNSVSGTTNYVLQQKKNNEAWVEIYNNNGNSKGLDNEWGTWSYQIKSCCGSICSQYSAPIIVQVPKPPPPEFTVFPAVDYNGSYSLTWSTVIEAIDYQIEESTNGNSNWVNLNLTPNTSTTINITGKTVGIYYYRVKANPFDEYCKTIISVEVIVPEVPLNQTGPSQVQNNTPFTISWDSVTDASSYTLQKEYSSSGDWITVNSYSGASASISESDPGVWKYRVNACSTVGCSEYTTGVTVLVAPPVPGTPTGPETNYTGSYTISWSSVSGAGSYQLDEQFNSGSWNTVYDGSSTTVSVSGRTTAGTWNYRVRTYGVTYSNYSSTKSVVVSVPVTPVTPTGPSTDSDGSYTISWSAATGAVNYQLEENFNGAAWSEVYNNTGLSRSRSGRSPGTWNYRLKASNPIGTSGYSGIKTVLVPPPVPATPTGPATNYTGTYTISWNSVTGANTYQLQERFNNGSWSSIQNSSSTSITRTGRSIGTWDYRVRAYGVAYSSYSGIKSVSVVSYPPTVTFAVGSAEIDLGDQVTLSWSTAYADTIVIEPGVYSGSEVTGEVSVSPTQIINVYTITATGPGGSISDSVTVYLRPVGIYNFSASTSLVTSGGHVALSWSVKNAVSVTIGPGNLYSGNAQTGSVDVYPTADTTYILTVDGKDGPLTNSVFIDVVQELPEKGTTYEYDELGRIIKINRVK